MIKEANTLSMERTESINIGRFQIVNQLGKGAQGVVYLATDPYLQRQVAVKVLNVKSARAKALQSNFLQEARTVSKLQHPNIVPIFEAGEHEGTPYLVFEYVHGISLLELIEKKPLSQFPVLLPACVKFSTVSVMPISNVLATGT